MPLAHARRFRVALWIALLALLVPVGLTLREVGAGGVQAWLRVAALIVVAATLIAALSRQRSFEARGRNQQAADEAVRASEAKFSGILAIAADAIISSTRRSGSCTSITAQRRSSATMPTRRS